MPTFSRDFSGPRVITSGQVTSGAASSGQQVWIGSRPRSTSGPVSTRSWQGARPVCFGDMFSTCFTIGKWLNRLAASLTCCGSFSFASVSPSPRKAAGLSSPSPQAMRCGVPNRLASTGSA
jgi:hypothetical protein